jgi:ketosteroid isomerase-like protein
MEQNTLSLDTAAALRFAEEWIQAWNQRDLERILAHYAEDVTLCSPVVARLLGIADGTLRGRSAVRDYFTCGLQAYPDLRFELIDVLCGLETIVLYYRNQAGTQTAEVMQRDAAGKVCRVWANYSQL